jgi:teichuronic acid biosynthesis glycosyltransferase TuaC
MFVCDHFPSGSNKNIFGQVRALAKHGHEVLVVAASVGKTGNRLPRKNWDTFKVVRLPSVKVPGVRYTISPFAEFRLEDLFDSFDPDIVHSHFIMYHLSLSSSILARRGIPLILTLHGFTLPQELGKSLQRIPLAIMYSTLGKRMVDAADHLICVSKRTEQKFLQVYRDVAEKTSTLHIGLDLDYEETLVEVDRDQARKKLGLDNHHTFVFVGRMSKWKGVTELAKAFSLLRRENDDIAMLFVGDGPCLESLRKKYSGVPDMHFLGYRKDVGTLMRAADILVLPSYREGLSTVMLEGMYSGLPFLATDVGGVRDMLNLGAKGLMIPEPSPDLIYEGLRQFAGLSHETLASYGMKNRALIQQEFSWDSLLPKLLDVYDSATKHAKGRGRLS